MTDSKGSGEQNKGQGIPPQTVAWFLLGGGVIFLGWALINFLSQRSEITKKLLDSYIAEVEDMESYTRDPNFTEDGLQARAHALDDKVALLQQYGQTFVQQAATAATNYFRSIGLYIIVPLVFAMGMYIAWQLLKIRRGPPSGGFRCDKDGLVFADEASLQAHIRQVHQPQTNPAQLNDAQMQFQQQLQFEQGAVATESTLYDRAKQSWSTLSGVDILNLAFGLESVAAYGVAGQIALRTIALILIAY